MLKMKRSKIITKAGTQKQAGVFRSCHNLSWPALFFSVLCLLPGLLVPACALQIYSANSANALGLSPTTLSTALPGGDASAIVLTSAGKEFSLSVSFLPTAGAPLSKSLLSSAFTRGYADSFGSDGLPARNNLSLGVGGKGNMTAEYAPSAALKMKFTYEHNFALQGAKVTPGALNTNFNYEIVYTPSSKSSLKASWNWLRKEAAPGAHKSLAAAQSARLDYEVQFSKGLFRIGQTMQLTPSANRTNRESATTMQIAYAPSAKSSLKASWNWLQKEAAPGAHNSLAAAQNARLDYEVQLSKGLFHIGQAMQLTPTAGRANRENATTVHLELKPDSGLSLAADFLSKRSSLASENTSTLAGKLPLSSKANFAFKFLRQSSSSRKDTARADASFDAQLGSAKSPLHLQSRLVNFSLGDVKSGLREFTLDGGFGKEGKSLKFAGLMRDQQGSLEGRTGGNFRNFRLEGAFSRIKMILTDESLAPEKGVTTEKHYLEMRAALSPSADLFWQRQREQSCQSSGRDEFGLAKRFGPVELKLGREQKIGLAGDQNWDTARIFIKTSGALPEWAKGIGEKPLFDDGRKYGFTPTPAWSKITEPGLEISLRRRSGLAGEARQSLRLIYDAMLRGLHLRLGHETNTWVLNNGNEQVTLGRKELVEIGVPVNAKYASLLRFVNTEDATVRGQSLFVALRGKLSPVEQLECYVGNESKTSPLSGIGKTKGQTYGLAYSRTGAEKQSFIIKAAVNPPQIPNKPLEDWQVDFSLKREF